MDKKAYILSKKYTDDTAIQFGGLKGANAQIKSVVHQDGQNVITFLWRNDDDEEQETEVTVNDGTPIYVWTSGDSYEYGDLAIYEACFYRCISENSDTTFDVTKWDAIGSPDGSFGLVESSSGLPSTFTAADRRLYYSMEDYAFWLWNGSEWELQTESITEEEIDALFA